MAKVRDALAAAGVDEGNYCGHSFRIGAATTAAKRGVEDSVIKTLGRWESTAYFQFAFLGNNLRDTPACWGRRDRTCVRVRCSLSNYVEFCSQVMWGEGPYGPSLGRAGGRFRPPSAPPPSLTSAGGGAHLSAKYYTRLGGLFVVQPR